MQFQTDTISFEFFFVVCMFAGPLCLFCVYKIVHLTSTESCHQWKTLEFPI